MRRIVAFNRVTADGYFASSDGNLDWVVPEDELDKEAAGSLGGGPDTILFGRRTYEQFERLWPYALDDSPTAPDPHMPKTPFCGNSRNGSYDQRGDENRVLPKLAKTSRGKIHAYCAISIRARSKN